MVFTTQYLFAIVGLIAISTCSASNESNEPAPPSITVKEDFNSPAIINPVSAYGPPPMVSNFVHQGTNFFFNPQFLLGNNVPPPLGAVVAAIPNPPNVEVIVNETVMTPELPIITPVEVIVEEPIEIIAPPPPPSLIPVIPEIPEVPVLIRDIPPAPVLPPLVLPKIPVWVEETVEVVAPCEEKEIVITDVKPVQPVVIPQPPSLPPLVLPPKILVSEIEINTQQPVVATTEVPIVPKKDMAMEFSKMKLTNEESLQLIPGSSVAEVDFKINEIPSSIEFPNFDNLLSVNEDKTMLMMPPRPELPVISIPKPVSEVLLIENDKELVIPAQLPTDCARNIVLERVLPNMISKQTVTKSLEIISFPAAKYPVVAPLIPAL